MNEPGGAHEVGMVEKSDPGGDGQAHEEHVMVSPSSPAFVITVSGVSGAGKSSTVRATAEQLGNASCFHFDDYGEAMRQPDDGLAWIAAGANLMEFVLPEFARDLRALREGQAVTTLFEGMREVYTAINERVKENSHLVLDGTQTVEHNATTVVAALEAWRGVSGPVE